MTTGIVKSGVTKEFLKREYQRAAVAETTGNCREECTHCGIGCRDGGTADLGRPASDVEPPQAPDAAKKEKTAPPELTTRIRIKFSRTGRLRFLSHLDFMTLVHRTVMRAGVPVAFSQGFNPHPKLAFGPALSVGMESEAEYLDMETDPFVDLPNLASDLNAALPEGIRILAARAVPRKSPSLSGSIGRYIYRVTPPPEHRAELAARVRDFLERETVVVERNGKQSDIRPGIESASERGATDIEIVICDTDQARPRIQDVIEKLFAVGRERATLFGIRRTAQFMRNNGAWMDPLDAS